MSFFRHALVAVVTVLALHHAPALADESSEATDTDATSPWDNLDFSTTWFLSTGYGMADGESTSGTRIGRGYLTFKFKPTPWFEPRVTLDAHQDDSGDFNVRLKYLYGKFIAPIETRVLTKPAIEFGLVHGPWFDYEEHIDHYRMQGPMFIERSGVLNSADAGATFTTLLGKELPADYQGRISKKYPGTLGSLALGVYNGGGYHAQENNDGKVFESRVSLRPLGPLLPNLQLSHFFVWGTGNTPAEVCDDLGICIPGDPDWRLNAFMGSFEHEYFVVTGQYAMGQGNQKGTQIDDAGASLDAQGASAFAEIKLPWIASSLIGRYDWWAWEDAESQRLIVGFAWHFLDQNTLLFDVDRTVYDDRAPVDWEAKLTLRVVVP